MSKYPDAFIERMKAKFGGDFDAFIRSLDDAPVTSIRLNPAKANEANSGLPLGQKILWSEQGYHLTERPSFTFDPLFHAGAYYVQESSSMFLEQAYRAIDTDGKALRVLDLCAAPGGKSTHLLSLLNEQSLLVSNELIASRNNILRQNIARWGKANTVVTQNKAEDFTKLGPFFDLIVIDAPCSGEGLFRKDKNAINEWCEANVTMCAERQRDILHHITTCLKPGGHIIYSTCTYEEAENLDNVNYLIEEQGYEQIEISAAEKFKPELAAISKGAIGYAFYPHKTKGEGFFISVLKKPGSYPQTPSRGLNAANDKLSAELMPHLTNYIEHGETFTVLKHGQYYNILPTIFLQDYKWLSQNLYVRNAGISAGEIKGKDFIPAHELSLFTGMKKDFPSLELDHRTAISYLKAETISLLTAHKGWMTVRHKGLNLGFVKALPNRINNYFPKEWRILKAQP